MITIVPVGGLCNRMRSVASACILARRAQQPLRVHWYRTPSCNARFDSLFHASDVPFRVAERWSNAGFAERAVREYALLRRRLGGMVLTEAEASPGAFDAERTVEAARRGNVYIRSFATFLREPGMLDVFRPVDALRRRIESLEPALAGATAVHVRRTDNALAIEKSPLSAFFALIDAEIARDPGARFFVASDSRDAYRDLSERYGDRVFEHPKPTTRTDDPEGVAHAVVDLYALSRCKRVIGSYWSSFTETAAQLGGIERIVATGTVHDNATIPAAFGEL